MICYGNSRCRVPSFFLLSVSSLFIMYVTHLSSLLRKAEDIKHHLYAGDTQVHNSVNTYSLDNSIHNLQNSLVSFQDWLCENKLKLNPNEAKFLLIGIKHHRKDFLSSFSIDILHNSISPTPSARNLGIIFDKDFSFVPHINSIVKSCHYHMREFRGIHKHLDWDTAFSVANAIVGSRIDHCNSLLYGVHKTDIIRL